MPLLSLFVAFVVFCFVIWAVLKITAAFAIPAPISTLIYVLVVGVALLYLLGMVTGSGPILRLR